MFATNFYFFFVCFDRWPTLLGIACAFDDPPSPSVNIKIPRFEQQSFVYVRLWIISYWAIRAIECGVEKNNAPVGIHITFRPNMMRLRVQKQKLLDQHFQLLYVYCILLFCLESMNVKSKNKNKNDTNASPNGQIDFLRTICFLRLLIVCECGIRGRLGSICVSLA